MKNPVYLLLLFLLCVTKAFSSESKVLVLGIEPIKKDNQVTGYYLISKDLVRYSKNINYYVSRCDKSMKPLKTIEFSRNFYDEMVSTASNNNALCIAIRNNGDKPYLARNNTEIELLSFDSQTLEKKGAYLIKGDYYNWHESATLIKNSDDGFIMNGRVYAEDKIEFKGIYGFDNTLNLKWQFSQKFPFDDERIYPITYRETDDQYIYNFYARKAKLITSDIYSGFLINKGSDGSLVFEHRFQSEEVKIVDKPALYTDGKRAVLFGDFNISKRNGNFHLASNKRRGLMICDIDIEKGKAKEKYLYIDSVEIQSKLTVEQKEIFQKQQHLHPFRATKVDEKYFVIGDIYTLTGYGIECNFVSDGANSSHVFIAEFDNNLNFQKITIWERKTGCRTTREEASYRSIRTNSLLDLWTNNNGTGFKFRYLDYFKGNDVDHIIVSYANGKLSTSKKLLVREEGGNSLNAIEGEKDQFVVLRITKKNHMEILLDNQANYDKKLANKFDGKYLYYQK